MQKNTNAKQKDTQQAQETKAWFIIKILWKKNPIDFELKELQNKEALSDEDTKNLSKIKAIQSKAAWKTIEKASNQELFEKTEVELKKLYEEFKSYAGSL